MAQDISLLGAVYSDVPSVLLPKQGGGTAQFDDTTDADATASDILTGKTAYVNGVKITGTGTGGGGSVTQDQDGFIVLPPTGGGGGGSSYNLLYSAEVTASTTSTSSTSVATLSSGETFEQGKMYMVSVIDKAGKRSGYFYRCDNYFFIKASTFASSTIISPMCFAYDSNGALMVNSVSYGVYLYRYYGGANMGKLDIYSRYSSSTTGTVDGTFVVKLYEVSIPDAIPTT